MGELDTDVTRTGDGGEGWAGERDLSLSLGDSAASDDGDSEKRTQDCHRGSLRSLLSKQVLEHINQEEFYIIRDFSTGDSMGYSL